VVLVGRGEIPAEAHHAEIRRIAHEYTAKVDIDIGGETPGTLGDVIATALLLGTKASVLCKLRFPAPWSELSIS